MILFTECENCCRQKQVRKFHGTLVMVPCEVCGGVDKLEMLLPEVGVDVLIHWEECHLEKCYAIGRVLEVDRNSVKLGHWFSNMGNGPTGINNMYVASKAITNWNVLEPGKEGLRS